MDTVRVAAVDLGASSGRVVAAEVGRDTLRVETVARFPNGPLRLPDGLHWDLPGLYAQVLAGLRRVVADGAPVSIGIDSWAVDYGLLKDGRLLGLPFHYRDERRGELGPQRVHAQVPPAQLYARTGLQFLPFTTVFQLAADPWVAHAARVLLVPDLLTHWLTGAEVAERTNASTTGLLDVHTGEWDLELVERLGLPARALAPLVSPGDRIGGLLPHVRAEVGGDAEVVAVGSHDTASAVVGVPMTTDDAAYLSLGTWGLVGLELDRPVLSAEARAANFTNERGVDGTVRFLTNVMGTWMLSETLRTWGRAASDLPGLLAAAEQVTGDGEPIDVQDPRFAPPGDMPARIADWCHEHGVRPPQGEAETVRLVLDSLAEAYADAVRTAARLAGREVRVLHVVGGGAQNRALCQAIADRSGLPVQAGPVEATAIGNVLVQARAAGATGASLGSLRALVRATHETTRFAPRGRSGVRT